MCNLWFGRAVNWYYCKIVFISCMQQHLETATGPHWLEIMHHCIHMNTWVSGQVSFSFSPPTLFMWNLAISSGIYMYTCSIISSTLWRQFDRVNRALEWDSRRYRSTRSATDLLCDLRQITLPPCASLSPSTLVYIDCQLFGGRV